MKFMHIVVCAMSTFLLPTLAWAATPANAEPLEEVPSPPKVQDGEALDEPEITIRKKGKETIEEYRINGELYMMKIIPEHGVPYYLHKEDQEGGWINIGPNPPLAIPKWILFRF
ncbi:MAG: DUF2782 domain-containing protein [Methylophilaceae bacterium]